MNHSIFIFIKMGSLEHITDLYENGTVYLNSVKYFRKVEDGNLRGDQNEGAINLANPKNGTFRISGIDRDFNFISARYGNFLETGNLYSLYCISTYGFPNPLDFKFDERNLEFGSHCLIIKKPGLFIERIENELRKLGYEFEHAFVKYYEEKIQRMDLTPFHKHNTYEYQKEFRVFVNNPVSEPIKVKIGSMKSFSELFKAEDLMNLELKPSREL